MNTIATIVPYASYPSVTYYTIHLDGKEQNETDEFLDKYEYDPEYEDDIIELLRIIQEWGEDGIPHYHRRLLRDERAAKALPPKGIRRKTAGRNLIRLYCYLIGDNVMILGNGGHKIRPDSTHQESPALRPHFELFNRISDELDEMIVERDLWVEGDELEGEMEIWIK